jgi:hypothetical protein
VRERRELVLPSLADDEPVEMHEPLALLSAEGSFGFRAVVVPIDDDGFPCVSKECREALGVARGPRRGDPPALRSRPWPRARLPRARNPTDDRTLLCEARRHR